MCWLLNLVLFVVNWSTPVMINCKLLLVVLSSQTTNHRVYPLSALFLHHCHVPATHHFYSLQHLNKTEIFLQNKTHKIPHTDGTDGTFSKCWRLLSRVSIISGKSTRRDVDFPQFIEYCIITVFMLRSTNIS